MAKSFILRASAFCNKCIIIGMRLIWHHVYLCLVNNTGTPVLPVSTSPAAQLVAAKESTSNPPLVSAESTDAIPSSTAVSVTVPKPAIAPMVFVGRVSAAPTVLLVGASQFVTQPPRPSSAVSETTETTQLILKPAASPGSTPQATPSPDSSVVSGVEPAQVKVGYLCAVLGLTLWI